MSRTALNRTEITAGTGLAAVVAMRMFGLFLVLPVFSILAQDIAGQTPFLIGVAIGVYGLTQALLQQVFGHWSDRWGRRRLMLLGLGLFCFGGLVAALADHIYIIILGRAIQGSGAIAAVALAWAGDISRSGQRARVMAIIGMAIGAAFLASMILSAPLAVLVGLKGLFALTSLLALLGMVIVWLMIPVPIDKEMHPHPGPAAEDVAHEGTAMQLRVYNFSIFILHAILTGIFISLPRVFIEKWNWPLSDHWQIYTPVMLLSVVMIWPLLKRRGHLPMSPGLIAAALILQAVALISVTQTQGIWVVFPALILYFAVFNAMEALFPAQISELAGTQTRGRTMGRYTSSQFLGAFAGGMGGGLLLQFLGAEYALLALSGVLVACSVALYLFAGNKPVILRR